MKAIFYLVVFVSMYVGYCAETSAQEVKREKPPVVVIDLVCGEKDRFRFRLSNRTPWVISVTTYNHYFDWFMDGDTRKPRTTHLATGGVGLRSAARHQD